MFSVHRHRHAVVGQVRGICPTNNSRQCKKNSDTIMAEQVRSRSHPDMGFTVVSGKILPYQLVVVYAMSMLKLVLHWHIMGRQAHAHTYSHSHMHARSMNNGYFFFFNAD